MMVESFTAWCPWEAADQALECGWGELPPSGDLPNTWALRFGSQTRNSGLYNHGKHFAGEKCLESIHNLVTAGLITLYWNQGGRIHHQHDNPIYEHTGYTTFKSQHTKNMCPSWKRHVLSKILQVRMGYQRINWHHLLEEQLTLKENEQIPQYEKVHNFKVHTHILGQTAVNTVPPSCGASLLRECNVQIVVWIFISSVPSRSWMTVSQTWNKGVQLWPYNACESP